jgi:hypothetical protein
VSGQTPRRGGAGRTPPPILVRLTVEQTRALVASLHAGARALWLAEEEARIDAEGERSGALAERQGMALHYLRVWERTAASEHAGLLRDERLDELVPDLRAAFDPLGATGAMRAVEFALSVIGTSQPGPKATVEPYASVMDRWASLLKERTAEKLQFDKHPGGVIGVVGGFADMLSLPAVALEAAMVVAALGPLASEASKWVAVRDARDQQKLLTAAAARFRAALAAAPAPTVLPATRGWLEPDWAVCAVLLQAWEKGATSEQWDRAARNLSRGWLAATPTEGQVRRVRMVLQREVLLLPVVDGRPSAEGGGQAVRVARWKLVRDAVIALKPA